MTFNWTMWWSASQQSHFGGVVQYDMSKFTGGHIAANRNAKATSYGADGVCPAAPGPAYPEWQLGSRAAGGDAGEVLEYVKESVCLPRRGAWFGCLRQRT